MGNSEAQFAVNTRDAAAMIAVAWQGATWNFAGFIYRIKSEPKKPKEWWFVCNLGEEDRRYGWTRYDVKQICVDYLVQVHVREVIDEQP